MENKRYAGETSLGSAAPGGAGPLEAALLQLLEAQDPRLHFGYEEAASRLGVNEKWLRERIGSLPHRKMGKAVLFTAQDLQEISARFAVRPAEQAARSRFTGSLADLKPAGSSRRQAA